MNISDHLGRDSIYLGIRLKDKTSALRFIAEACAKKGIVKDPETLFAGFMDRESEMSTGIGNGLGFPHTVSQEAKAAAVVLVRTEKPIQYDSLDGKPVDVILALVIPKDQTATHIRLLARLARLCKSPEFISAIRSAADPDQIWEKIHEAETKNNVTR